MELVDTGDLKSPDLAVVPVQVRPRAPLYISESKYYQNSDSPSYINFKQSHQVFCLYCGQRCPYCLSRTRALPQTPLHPAKLIYSNQSNNQNPYLVRLIRQPKKSALSPPYFIPRFISSLPLNSLGVIPVLRENSRWK